VLRQHDGSVKVVDTMAVSKEMFLYRSTRMY
jgi:hypothetical protein